MKIRDEARALVDAATADTALNDMGFVDALVEAGLTHEQVLAVEGLHCDRLSEVIDRAFIAGWKARGNIDGLLFEE